MDGTGLVDSAKRFTWVETMTTFDRLKNSESVSSAVLWLGGITGAFAITSGIVVGVRAVLPNIVGPAVIQTEFSIVVDIAAVAGMLLLSLGIFFVAVFIAGVGVDRTRVFLIGKAESPGAAIASYVGAGAGLATGFTSQILHRDLILSAFVTLVVAVVAVFASRLIIGHPARGLSIYAGLLLAVLALAWFVPSAHERHVWIEARTERDWVVIALTVLVGIGVPAASVWAYYRRGRVPRRAGA